MMGLFKSKRGGGPKTAAGKLAVASNALKTGAIARERFYRVNLRKTLNSCKINSLKISYLRTLPRV